MLRVLTTMFAGVRGPGRMPSREDSSEPLPGEPGEDDPDDDFPWPSAHI